MQWLFARNFLTYLFLFLLVSGVSWYALQHYASGAAEPPETTTVSLGNAKETVTISGKVEADQVAKLGFPVSGTIQNIYKVEGDLVAAGEVVASLTSDSLVAEYNAALEQVRYLEQVKQELVRGPVETKRAVARADVQIAEANLAAVIAEYEQAIRNARQALLSTDLSAYPTNPINDDIPPTISGSYLCDNEGQYEVSLFSSGADSGRSYRLTGLQSGTYVANADTSAPLGDCGLYIKFSADEIYRNSTWVIEIPNRRSSSYITLKNEYDLLVTKRDAAVQSAIEAVTLAKNAEADLVAPASPEEIGQTDANIAAARATLVLYEARIADYTIRAPFAGIVSSVDMKIGEPTSPLHSVTIVYEGNYKLTAQIPEIDITKVSVGDKALVKFDAKTDTTFSAVIDFIAPLSTPIGGVAYYEAQFTLEDEPLWLREGLNGDVVIESHALSNVPVIPKRFITFSENQAYVLVPDANAQPVSTPVTLGFVGTDGNVEVTDLPLGTVVMLP